VLATEFDGWQAAILTSDLELGKAIGLRSHKRYTFWNGPIEAYLLLFELKNNTLNTTLPEKAPAVAAPDAPLSEGATMFANRIRKNRRRLSSWLKREQVSCYRLYDADMPEYAVAVDVYGDAVHVAEYQAPKGVDEAAASRRLGEVKAALPTALDIDPGNIVYKQRRRQRGSAQYEKLESRGEFIPVQEGQARLLVNLHDYLDTGLFLDHRPLRLRIAAEARGKRFLNLFCYTGTATVHAALGGASHTRSVDLSNTYLGWLRKNLALNGLAEGRHVVVKADCLTWLQDEQDQFDIVLLDPPSFSNSSGMSESFDVQRDQLPLVHAAMKRLSPDGVLYFSNNRRRFKLDPELLETYVCADITRQTLDPDFERNPRIHNCWMLKHADSGQR
jgi:23S rRNA (guanine2445-N2)-methyltransferase / 23S rRNA (guanine2069-N7)-methyltransferase